MPFESAHLPAWVRRRDGSQVPFDADRICQSLFLAAESLGKADAFLIRELTDAVLHFLTQQLWDIVPTTLDLVEEIVKILREIGQPALSRRYAELQHAQTLVQRATPEITVPCSAAQERFVRDCLSAYALKAVYSRDVSAAIQDGLLRLDGGETPATLASLAIQTLRLAELPWWLALEDWRIQGGDRWIVDSPEWLCTPQMHPALTPHLCERLLSLPTVAERAVEIHLNVAEPPSWSLGQQSGALFQFADGEGSQQERSNFQDSLLERWKTLAAPRPPGIAWHIHERTFRDETQRRQLQSLLRHSVQGRPVRFVFDRAGRSVALAEGLERKNPGLLLLVGLNLHAFAGRPEVAWDGAALIKRLPSLARMAVSAIAQKRQFLRGRPEESPLRQRFLIERCAGAVTPLGLEELVQTITGAKITQSPLSFDFALRLLETLRTPLEEAGRLANLDIQLEVPPLDCGDAHGSAQTRQLEAVGKLHAGAGAGTARLLVGEDAASNATELLDLMGWTWASTALVRLELVRAGSAVRQGELPI